MLSQNVNAWLRSRVVLTAALSGVVCTLASHSAFPQVSQGMGDVSGEQAFNNACRTCHMVREGDNRLGPNLYKIVGRDAGSLSGYVFSSAMRETEFAWDEEKLDRFIANPDEVVGGNNMKPYGGLAVRIERRSSLSSPNKSKRATLTRHEFWLKQIPPDVTRVAVFRDATITGVIG